ncbi:MAG TPA: hypothetical protein PLJ08_04480, partial [Cyclobacteriaceae bacterium]|nr:hypothetical protein [Cyclobacteriaceae bacterium]
MTISKNLSVSRLPLVGAVLLWTAAYAVGLHYFFTIGWEVAATDSALFNLVTLSSVVLLYAVIGYIPRTGIFQITLGAAVVFAFLSQWLAQQATAQL